MDSNTTSSTNFYTFLKQREEKPKQKQTNKQQKHNENSRYSFFLWNHSEYYILINILEILIGALGVLAP